MEAAGMAMASAAAPSEGEGQAVHVTCSKYPRGIVDKCHWTPEGGGSIGNSAMTSTPLHTMRLEMLTLAFGLVVWGMASPSIDGT